MSTFTWTTSTSSPTSGSTTRGTRSSSHLAPSTIVTASCTTGTLPSTSATQSPWRWTNIPLKTSTIFFRRSIPPVADFARDLIAPPAPTSIWSTSFTIADSLGWRQGSGKQRIIRETLLKWKTWLGGDLSQVGGEEVILIPMFTYRSADQASKSKKRLNRFRGGGVWAKWKEFPSITFSLFWESPQHSCWYLCGKGRAANWQPFLYWLHIYVTFNICSMCFRSHEMKFQLLLQFYSTRV